MRKFVTLLLAAAMLCPMGAQAKSIYSQECDCENPTDAQLEGDPRSLATIENGYRSYWEECHGDPNVPPRPQTCRQWCEAAAKGKVLLETQGLIGSFLDRDDYNYLWKAWGGLSERPTNFDQRVVDRYGLQVAAFHNPYPLPDEPTRSVDGGLGQLPMGLIQTRGCDENGENCNDYNGGIGFTCLLCHAGRIGDESDGPGLGSRMGIGNTTFDIEVLSTDLGKSGGTPIPLPYPHSEGRGTINAVSDFEFLMAVRDFDTLDQTPFVKTFPAHASPGDQDPPAWHNTGSRPRVYMDGGVSSDNARALMQFLTASLNFSGNTSPDTPGSGAWIKKQEADFESIRVFIDSIEPPKFPKSIDLDGLAAAGEALFHCKNLFGSDADDCGSTAPNAVFGNGSCSSCHGVYSETYASRLPDFDANATTKSRMLGIAGQIVPWETIRTDRGRVDALAPELRWGWGTLWFAYADNAAKDDDPWQRQFNEVWNDFVTSDSNEKFYTREQGDCGWVGVDEPEDIRSKLIGYAAPPLHGVWSTAPYFHNGSVPTVYDVLRYGQRPRYWKRPLRDTDYPDRGFDVSLDAYDYGKLGWMYQRLDCDGVPLAQCDPQMPLTRPETGSALNTPASEVWLANQSPRPLTQTEIELRKIYDTTRYGRSNDGHWWTNSTTLSEGDVEKLIEYLKTL